MKTWISFWVIQNIYGIILMLARAYCTRVYKPVAINIRLA
jgi:hypothetical protein